MKKAVIYNRVSTVMQEKVNSLELQTKQCEEFAAAKGYKVIAILTDVESGTKDDREGYLKLKELIRAKAFDTLIIYETSRISRKLLELLLFIELLQKNEIDFISATEHGYDTTTPEGKFAMSIRLSMIQFERDNTAKRVTERLYYKASKGQWLNGKPPRGYQLVDKKLIVAGDEAEVIKDIFKRFIAGETMYKICQLHDLKWGSKQVRRILTNITYAGYIRYGNRKHSGGNTKEAMIVKGLHDSIISLETYNAAQNILKNTRYKTPNNKLRYLLNGILKCRECGHSFKGLSGGSYNKNGYYGCALKKLKLTDKFVYVGEDCNTGNIKAEILEKVILKELQSVINGLNRLDSLSSTKERDEQKITRNLLNKLEGKRIRLLDTYIDGNLSKKDYTNRIRKIEIEITSLEKKLLNKVPEKQKIQNKKKLLGYFKKIDLGDLERANSILKMIIDKIVVYKGKNTAKGDFEIEIYLNII